MTAFDKENVIPAEAVLKLNVRTLDEAVRKRVPSSGPLNELPTHHNPKFLPALHPTLQTGVETLIIAARAWLSA